jgi:hypothetical protein
MYENHTVRIILKPYWYYCGCDIDCVTVGMESRFQVSRLDFELELDYLLYLSPLVQYMEHEGD